MNDKNNPPVAEKTPEEAYKEARDWCVTQGLKLDPPGCPFCGWEPALEANGQAAIAIHLGRVHREGVLTAHHTKSFDDLRQPDPEPADVYEAMGVTMETDFDRPDYLAVPRALKQRATSEGAVLRWASPENVARYKNMGARVVPLDHGPGARQPSTEDGIVRTNEMVLMKFPQELADERRHFRRSRIDQTVVSRMEDMDKAMEGQEKAAYDYLRRHQNMDHQQASQIARAVAGRTGRDALQYGHEDRHEGLHIVDSRQKG